MLSWGYEAECKINTEVIMLYLFAGLTSLVIIYNALTQVTPYVAWFTSALSGGN